MSELKRGYLFGIAAYCMWGFFPLYIRLLRPAGAVEILAHRIIWSSVTIGLLVVVFRRGSRFRAIMVNPRARWLLTLAAVVITANWVTYIWGVNNGRVVETSLGYFITLW